MVKMSKELLEGLQLLTSKVDVGIIAVADKTGLPIVYASNVKDILGYEPEELVGKTFLRVLPESVKPRHKALMDDFKLRADAGTSAEMAPGRAVKGVHKDGHEVDLSIAVSYHPSTDVMADGKEGPGLYLALVQDPVSGKASPKELQELRVDFNAFVYQGAEVTKKAVEKVGRAIAAKIAATGGIFGFIIWVITSITPIGKSVQDLFKSWEWRQKEAQHSQPSPSASPSIREGQPLPGGRGGSGSSQANPDGPPQSVMSRTPAPLRVVPAPEGFEDESRINNLKKFLGELREIQPEVMAIGYYKITQLDSFQGRGFIAYRADTEAADGKQVYFEDQILTAEEVATIVKMDCLIKKNVGRMVDRKGSPSFDAILCPTWSIGTVNGLDRQVLANVSAIAFEPGSNIVLEPAATLLFQVSPSIEALRQPR